MTDKIRGSCLCGGVSFAIAGPPGPIGQCHCSKCRKVSGTNGNSVFHASRENFEWTNGQDLIAAYHVPDSNGWHSTFCKTCGSPLPLDGQKSNLFFVPAGLLDDDPGHRNFAAHIFVDSKAPWVAITDDAPQFSEGFGSERRDRSSSE
ncbi:GFA family protein [Parasphingorhabdus sp.]|uniref:GFA family protein n=1 Tax=Parasphingorhabdus sp. TaxID=2709688 RepID=UPI003262EEA5